MAAKVSYLISAAIDFGTTYSGYAFSFTADPEAIVSNKNWGQALGFQSYKTPTSILTNSVGEFVDMGYDADQKYNQNREEGTEENFHLYRHFKMALHSSKNLNMKTNIVSEDGMITPALKIFGFAIGYLRRHLLKAVKDNTTGAVDTFLIRWVITVPAIWSESAKQFMRHAAKLGGCIDDISSENLILALEPEAASMCCRRPRLAGYSVSDGAVFPENTKYVLLDCGGGTVDVSAHQVGKDGKVKEILPASGGPWGGMFIDKKFEEMLGDIFSNDFLNKYKANYPQDWVELMQSFETAKKPFDGSAESTIRIRLPWSFGEFYSDLFEGKGIKQAIEAFHDNNVSFRNGVMVLKSDAVKCFYNETIEATISHLRHLLLESVLAHCNFIFMVGGLSDSPMIQNAIKSNFEENGTKVLIPAEAQMAVLKGAVLFGHYTSEISTRIARKTYGYGSKVKFDPKIHKRSYQSTKYPGYVRNVFHTLITKGEQVEIGKTIKRHRKIDFKVTSGFISIYSLDRIPNSTIQLATDKDVEKIKISPDFSKTNRGNVEIFYTFGETELKVRFKHVKTGKECTATVDILTDLATGSLDSDSDSDS